MSNSAISPIDRTLSGATTPGHSELWSDGNEGLFCILQISSVTGTSPSDCFVSNVGHSLEKSYPSAEMMSVYPTATADWALFSGGGVLLLCWDAFGVFDSLLSRLG